MPGSGSSRWADEELVPISALQHWSYCPRQCALIHVEQTFDENLFTLQGRFLHERADEPRTEEAADLRIERSLPLYSERLGLVGRADVVEFHHDRPLPVEYKRGKRRRWGHDELQLCAQGLCLEEMLGVPVPRGAVYYHGSRRRLVVELNGALRAAVENATAAVRRLLVSSRLPPPVADGRCRHCSLREACQPSVITKRSRLAHLDRLLFSVDEAEAS